MTAAHADAVAMPMPSDAGTADGIRHADHVRYHAVMPMCL